MESGADDEGFCRKEVYIFFVHIQISRYLGFVQLCEIKLSQFKWYLWGLSPSKTFLEVYIVPQGIEG